MNKKTVILFTLMLFIISTSKVISEENKSPQDLSLKVYLDDELYTFTEYTKLFKIRNHDSKIGEVHNITVHYNISRNNEVILNNLFIKEKVKSYSTTNTGLFTPTEAGNYTICGKIISSTTNDNNSINDFDCKNFTVILTSNIQCNISLNLIVVDKIYNNQEKIKFKFNLTNKTFPFEIEYWFEDLLGGIVKNKKKTSNTNQKTYTPKIYEKDAVYILKTKLSKISCNNTHTKTLDEKLIIIKGRERTASSSITIKSITGTKEFGKIIKPKILIYKGDTSKSQVKIYLEKNKTKYSEITYLTLGDKKTNYSLTIPIKLKCSKRYKTDSYNLVVDGLDVKTFSSVPIRNSTCGEPKPRGKKFDYSLKDYPEVITPNTMFTSKLIIINNDEEKADIKVWSYIYKGSKIYSGSEKENMKSYKIDSDSESTILLKNYILEAKPDTYKFKIVIDKEDLKTNKVITKEVIILPEEKEIFIDSFYTINNNSENSTMLYANFSSIKQEKVTTELDYSHGTEELDIKTDENVIFPVLLNPGQNTFFLTLKKDDKIMDYQKLDFNVANTIVKKQQNLTLKNVTTKKIQQPKVIYISSSIKARQFLVYFLVFTLTVIITTLIKKY